MTLKSLAIKASYWIWYLTLVLLVIVATYVAVGRNFFGYISAYKTELEATLSEMAGASVRVGRLEGRWDGLDPVLLLQDVRLYPEGASAPLLNLSNVRLQPDAVASLFGGGLVFRHIQVGDVGLTLDQQTEGGWKIAGLSELGGGADTDWTLADLNRLLASPTLEFRDIRLHWQFSNNETLHWIIPVLSLNTSDGDLKISGIVHNQDTNEPLGIFSLAERDELDGDGLGARLYLNWRHSDLLRPLLRYAHYQETEITAWETTGSAWLEIQAGELRNAVTEFSFANVQWQRAGEPQKPVDRIAGLMSLERAGNLWQVKANDLSLDWGGRSLELNRIQGQIAGAAAAEDTPDRTRILFERVNAGFLAELALASGLLPASLSESLLEYQPSGWLNQLMIRTDEQTGELVFHAQLEDVAVTAFDGAPGGQNINGYLEAGADWGRVTYAGDDFFLDFPELFERGWRFDYGEGVVAWHLFREHTYVSGTGMVFENPDGEKARLDGRFSILIADADDVASAFELAIGIRETDARLTTRFVPGKVVSPELMQWLTDSVQGGVIRNGGYLYSGLVGEMAPDDSYRSQMFFNIDQGSLRFSPDWPALTDFNASLLIDGSELSGTVGSAMLAGSHLSDVTVRMYDTDDQQSILNINATDYQPEEADWTFWLQESPLAREQLKAFEGWNLSGDASLDLAVSLSLDNGSGDVSIEADLQEVALVNSDAGLELTGLRGPLSFDTRSGIRASQLEGMLLGHQVVIGAASDGWSETTQNSQITIRGSADLDRIWPLLKVDPVERLSGQFDYRLRLALSSAAEHPVSLSLLTDLKGVASLWPQPFSKDAGEKWPLEVVLDSYAGDDEQSIRIELKDRLAGRLQLGGDSSLRGIIDFRGNAGGPLPESGLTVTGRPGSFRLEDWQNIAANGDSGVGIAADWPDWLNLIDVELDRFALGNDQFRNLQLRLAPDQDGNLLLELDDQDAITGKVRIPASGTPVPEADFERLYLADKSEMVSGEPLTPDDVPLASVSIDDLKVGDQSMGSWSWVAESRDDGVVFNQVRGDVAGARVNARLSWLYDVSSQVHTTILTGDISGQKFEDFYNHWDKQPPLTAAEYSFNAGLVWSRPPFDFDWEYVNGQISMKMSSGAVQEASRATDLFRVLGILNTDSITRRLRLDFSDLYKSGLAFDQIDGSAKVREGVFTLDPPLAIQGPSSGYKISGRTSLVDDSLDLEMVVVLPVTQNLPLAALLIGAPQVGGALFLIDKLLGEPLSNLTSATYEIRGTFSNPEVKLKQIFDRTGQPGAKAKGSERAVER